MDPKTLELAQKATDVHQRQRKGEPGTADKLRRDFSHFLLDFNIIPAATSYVLALAFVDMVKQNTNDLIKFYIGTENKAISSILTFTILLFVLYIVSKYVWYGLILTEDVTKENVIMQAINEKKKEELKKEIEKKPFLKKELTKEVKHVKEIEQAAKEVKNEKRQKELMADYAYF